MYAIRFITGGTVIAAAVLAARILGPVWGGVVSSLPALLGSVLYFLNKSQGDKFLEGFLRLLPLSYVSSFVFLILIHQLLTKLPGVLAFTVAMSGALLCTSAILFFKRT
jgi:hypothetical protein